jgi:hypothetical protein
VIDEWQAKLIAAPWAGQDKPAGEPRAVEIHPFDLGYVLWRVLPLGRSEDGGSGRAVVDRQSGELTFWPSVPVPTVVELYRAYRQKTPVSPLTWDPVVRAQHDRVRLSFPENVTHLRLADGQLRIARTMKGDGIPYLHRLVREFLDGLPTEFRERGNDRCAEVAALSDAMHAEDARRVADGDLPPLTLPAVRTELLRGADLVTYRIREPGDPLGGQPTSPCVSCQAMLRHFGFALRSPLPIAGQDPGDER